MKKLFFFKSSTSNNVAPSQTKDKSFGDGIQDTRTSRSKKAAFEDQNQIQNSPHLRRSRSFSSGTFHDSGMLRTQSDSACSSSSNISHKQSAPRSSRRALTPERHSRTKWFEENTNGVDNVSLESSSYCSTNASNKILDRYIDGEQHHQEKTNKHSNPNSNTKTHQNNGGKRPPRFQYAAPASPTTEGGGGLTQKPRSHSFRDPNRESKLYMSTRDWVENGVVVHNHGSPRKLAKQVIERLSQSRVLPRVDSKEFDHQHDHNHDHEHEHGHDIPITLEDIYGGSHSHPDDTVLDYDDSEETDDVAFLKAELHSRTRKLEKEKNELQAALEKELDRRSTEWSMKLEKYQMEEHRLRERVRELAEQNVSLQREVSMYGEKELDSQSRVMHSGQQVKDLTFRMEEVIEENQNLHRDLSELQDRYRGAEEDRDCLKRNYNEKDKECKELHRAVTRLLRTCNEQEKTIDGLREGVSKVMKEKGCNFDHDVRSKLQSEQLRLTGVEQGLRKEVESCRVEVESLRHENINLLHRLKGSSKDNNFSTIKLDQELWGRVHCLQNQGMCLIKDCVVLCSKLLENIKERACHSSLERNEALQNGLDSQLVMESDMKLQGFKREAETLTRSLQNVADVLRDKSSCTVTPDIESSEEVVQSDLKAEALLTSLLREKLYAKEVDVERLEAELATAVRGNDVLKCEVQNAMDTLSCITHKMKELEMQVMKKEEGIYRLQNNLQDCKKELSIVNGILPKVTEERNMMWEEVQKYSENNMLLSSEIGMLKKKVEALDEDVLLKEGQITILKDAIGKPFDLLSSSPVTTGGFLL